MVGMVTCHISQGALPRGDHAHAQYSGHSGLYLAIDRQNLRH